MPAWESDSRETRRRATKRQDQRGQFQRDRDRILYSSAFRRLAGITQIVRAGESDVFHTRQQHTLKVAQIGRRLAEALIQAQPDDSAYHGVNPDVVEAACLAHDLGHPPFGHVGEKVLHKLVVQHDEDGFEGNAQSFRILTHLSVRFKEAGLNLTRATLAGCLKYPWLRDGNDSSKSKKWGAYAAESDDFGFAREHFAGIQKSAEAEIMDWADDVAYSVHDLEDFHRCGAIPWVSILDLEGVHAREIISKALINWFEAPPDAPERLEAAYLNLAAYLLSSSFDLLKETYEGTRAQRQQLRTMTSDLIGRYMAALTLVTADESTDFSRTVRIRPQEEDEVKILKQITRDYIIANPSLLAQQKGQEHIIQNLFGMIYQDSASRPPAYLPIRLHYLWDSDIYTTKARATADCIASLTEAEIVGLHNRLHGIASGSVLDPIVR